LKDTSIAKIRRKSIDPATCVDSEKDTQEVGRGREDLIPTCHLCHHLADAAREKKTSGKHTYKKANGEEDGSPLLQPPTWLPDR
jgi:hypothetical protein